MAPALSANTFGIATGPHTKPDSRTTKPIVTVYARQNLFGIGKPKSEPSEGENETETQPNRFFIDFSKIPDAKSLIPVMSSPSANLFVNRRRKDPNTVFVAGATGQSGTRIAQTLLRQGFAVRAGVPELAAAQELARLAATYKLISPSESKRLNAVESTFGDAESIAKAIGPATKVVITIGPGENGPTADVTTDDALLVIRAAELAGVGHVAVVYDSGSGASGPSTGNVLDGITSFFSNFFARTQALSLGDFLSKVVETNVSYTVIKAALTEDYSAESSYGLVVSKEGSNETLPNDSKVSKSQIAKLVADVFSNTSVAENKVVEVSTSPLATSKPIDEVFSAIPEDGRRKAYAEAMAKAKAEEEEAMIASEKAREAAEASKKPEDETKKLSDQEAKAARFSEEARAKAAAAGLTLDNLLSKANAFGGGGDFSWGKLSSQITTAVSSQKPEVKSGTQIATVRGQAKARSLLPQRAVIKQPATKPKPKKPEAEKAEVRKVFGGLFKQETIYMDDD